MVVEGIERVGEGLDGVVVARVLEIDADRGRRQDPHGRRRRRRGRAASRSSAARGTSTRATSCRSHRRRRAARRVRDRPAQDEGRHLQRDDLLGARARARRGPRRDHGAARRARSSPARRSPRRWASSPTWCSTSPSRPTVPTPMHRRRGPRRRRQARRCRSRIPEPSPSPSIPARRPVTCVVEVARAVPRFTATVLEDVTIGPSPAGWRGG